ncbi:hypothetical protein SDC9_148651 [bioreactor metagenome]|uniref:Uncharacterized protein n=1 Tax=bioreactor metagenome TaxID=1076179 RepID=A0A645EJJ0_9ZZZZ
MRTDLHGHYIGTASRQRRDDRLQIGRLGSGDRRMVDLDRLPADQEPQRSDAAHPVRSRVQRRGQHQHRRGLAVGSGHAEAGHIARGVAPHPGRGDRHHVARIVADHHRQVLTVGEPGAGGVAQQRDRTGAAGRLGEQRAVAAGAGKADIEVARTNPAGVETDPADDRIGVRQLHRQPRQ